MNLSNLFGPFKGSDEPTFTFPPCTGDTKTCPDGECITCGARDCPDGEPLHYHHDGCPACWRKDQQ